MKTVGFVRRVDELGRAVLPKDLRVKANIKKGEMVDLYKKGDKIYVCKQEKKFTNDKIQNSTRITRRVDELGRVVIPKEWRDELGIIYKQPLEIAMQDKTITLKPYIPYCIFCGDENELISYKEKLICNKCIKYLNNIKK